MMLAALMLLLLVLGAGWATNRLFQQRQAAFSAAAALAEARALAGEIERFRGRSSVAAGQAIGEGEMGEQIEAAASAAGLTGGWLDLVDHRQAERIGQSPFLEKPTTLRIDRVNLRQLLHFLHRLTAGTGFTLRELRLASPYHAGDAADLWDAEATVTYLIYEPAP
jgi:hypothetical protein